MNHTKPGIGWTNLGPAVWEHTSGTRIHVGGYCRLADGRDFSECRWPESMDAARAIAVCGGNRKRGMMVWAMNLMEETT
jgi:hypothetical protein